MKHTKLKKIEREKDGIKKQRHRVKLRYFIMKKKRHELLIKVVRAFIFLREHLFFPRQAVTFSAVN